MKHAVVILNYRGWQDTLACVASVKKAHNPPHIIVVDNASPDESVAQIAADHPDIEILPLSANLGYAGGNHHGITRALARGAELVYVLNNDTLVDRELFTHAGQTARATQGIVGAKIYYAKGYEYHHAQRGQGNILWYAGGDFDWQAVVGRHQGIDEVDHGQYDTPGETDFITGCFMAIPRHVIDTIGLFDERYFLYLEDADYCERAKRAGISRRYDPRCLVYHRNSATSGVGSCLVDYYLTRNRLYFGWQYGTWRLRYHLLKEGLTRHLKSRVRRQAFLDFLGGRMGSRHALVCHEKS